MMLKINQLNYSYKDKKVLSDINLSVENGEFFALTGLNGAGKTTLIKLILDLIRSKQKTDVLVAGDSSWLVTTKRHIAYLPEKFNIKASLSALDYFSLLSGIFKKTFKKNEIHHLCERLSFDVNSLDKHASSYSKGMMQKVGLMGCLLSDAPLLLFDEPLSGLDPVARVQFKTLLLEEKAKGNKTLFYNSHLLSDVEELCDRFAILHQQKIQYQGKPSELIKQYQTEHLEAAYMLCLKAQSSS